VVADGTAKLAPGTAIRLDAAERRLLARMPLHAITPSADIRETKVWRRSRGAHPVPRPAAPVILRNSRLTFAASSGVPIAEANTSP